MGVVYRAFDRQLRLEVALKTLINVDAGAIYRFKQEFRALSDVSHPNLVTLYELALEDETWFFTMELLEGVNFRTYMRGTAGAPDQEVTALTTTAAGSARPITITQDVDDGDPTTPDASSAVDEARLRPSLRQLAEGICALHASGNLHRDIKPSNVVVTPEHRVVLLDFGVVAELAAARWQGELTEVVGTPAYMSPEQAAGSAATEASDWYSVGVVLYELLSGRRPFTGGARKVMEEKQIVEPDPVGIHRSDVPEDLESLCMDLLSRLPEQRPAGQQVLARLAGRLTARVVVGARLARPRPAADVALVGRDVHLAELSRALDQAKRGEGATIYVHGSSGMGKTALISHFLDEVALDPAAVVLSGRCYQRESVPYKAVDSLVDSLCRFLMLLPEREAEALMPRGVQMLAKVFPVLRRVSAVRKAQRRQAPATDPRELRRRAFAALRDLLAMLAETRPVVLFIDDLQWGDVDSAPLLDALMRPPDTPPLLLIASYRTEEEERSALLQALFRRNLRLGPAANVHKLAVGELTREDSLALATMLLAAVKSEAPAGSAATIAGEAGGNPYFIHELVRHSATDSSERTDGALTLDAVIRARIKQLPEAARRLVEVVAVAGKPIEQWIAQRAAGLVDAERPASTQLVRSAHLVRASGGRDRDLIESYHDRIRETVVNHLAESVLRAHHQQLAIAIQTSDLVDPESLAVHFRGAGENDTAAYYAIQAADLAAEALAFDRAAELYELALELRAATGLEKRTLVTKLAGALSNTGRGAEAAKRYLEASELSTGVPALDLRRRAAEQFLRAGYVDEGLSTLGSMLGEVGVAMPPTPVRAVPGLLWSRFKLRLRGLRFQPRDRDMVLPTERLKNDACWSAATGLGICDPVRAAAFSSRNLLLALREGDPKRVSLALAAEAGYMASAKSQGRTRKLLAEADAIAESIDDPHARGFVVGIRGLALYEQGLFKECYETCQQAEAALRGHCTGVSWELRTMQMFSVLALFHMGAFNRLTELAPLNLADAHQCGDLYALMNMRALAMPAVYLGADDVGSARREVEDAEKQWSASGFYLQDLFVTISHILIDLYDGRSSEPHARCVEVQPLINRSLLSQDRSIRVFWMNMRAGCAMAAAIAGAPDAGRLVRSAKRDARRLRRDGSLPCTSMAASLYASIALARGNEATAIRYLEQAVHGFDGANMKSYAASYRLRLARLVGGDRGAAIDAEAQRLFTEIGVRNGSSAARALAPGFSDS